MSDERTTIVADSGRPHGGLTRDEVVAMFERRQRAADALDAAAFAADYAPNATIESPFAGPHVGPAAAEEALRVFFEALRPKTTTESLLIDGPRVVQVARLEGKNLGQLLGLPPSGKGFAVTLVVFCELEDGQIVREQRIYDFSLLLMQVGLLKAKPI